MGTAVLWGLICHKCKSQVPFFLACPRGKTHGRICGSGGMAQIACIPSGETSSCHAPPYVEISSLRRLGDGQGQKLLCLHWGSYWSTYMSQHVLISFGGGISLILASSFDLRSFFLNQADFYLFVLRRLA